MQSGFARDTDGETPSVQPAGCRRYFFEEQVIGITFFRGQALELEAECRVATV